MRLRALTIALISLVACTPRGGEAPEPSREQPSPPSPEVTPEPPAKPTTWKLDPEPGLTMIAPGVHHTCAIESGRVLCWGLNRFEMLGVGPGLPETVTAPRPVIGLDEAAPIVQVAADYDYSCALAQDGDVYCWGDNEDGELGVGDRTRRDRPTLVVNVSASRIYLGFQQACAISRDLEVGWCWGRGFGLAPVVVPELAGASELANPGSHTCTRKAGTMECWGQNSGGQIGNGEGGCEYDEPLCDSCKRLPDRTCKRVDTPTEPLGLPAIARIASGGNYTYALDIDGGVWQWGQVGETMSFAQKPNYRPQPVAEIPLVEDISAGSSHVCARADDGEVWCWGNNSFGQLGFESTDRRGGEHPSPHLVEGLPPAREVAAGFYYTCAITGEGERSEAWCWGDNGNGQLGDGTTERRHAPTRVLMPAP